MAEENKKSETKSDKYNFVALQVNYKYDTNTEKNPENVARTVEEWVKWRASMFNAFYKDNPTSVESIAWILHDKDLQLDTANDGEPMTDKDGNVLRKPPHIHAVIEFKRKNRKRLTTIRNYFGITHIENCKGINLNVSPIALPYRYLIHISERALSEQTKHIYSPEEVHTIGSVDYNDVIGITDASDAKKFANGIKKAFDISSTETKSNKKLDELEMYLNDDEASDMIARFYTTTLVSIANGHYTSVQARNVVSDEIERTLINEVNDKGERKYSDEIIESICTLFWERYSAKFDNAEITYMRQRATYLKGNTPNQVKPKFIELSPLDDPDSRNLITLYISGASATGKSQLAKYLGRRLDSVGKGVHYCPAPSEGKTFDFTNSYRGEDVSVFNDIDSSAFQKREFFSVFDEHQTAPVASRNNDNFWFAHYGIFTNTDSFPEFIHKLLKFSKGSGDFLMRDDKGRVTDTVKPDKYESYYSLTHQAMRRMNFVIETKQHADGNGSDYYLYTFHAFNTPKEDKDKYDYAYDKVFGHWLTKIYSVSDVTKGSEMKKVADEIGSDMIAYKRALLAGHDAYAFTFAEVPCNLYSEPDFDSESGYGFKEYDNHPDDYVLVPEVNQENIDKLQSYK